jgi:luciferase family oxidoreductase group 1
MSISLLEQSVLVEGSTAEMAVNNTVTIAETADRLGYRRIWLSEHHNMPILQGSSPEVLLAAMGARTSRIRIGSGGVMLGNHSPYRIAEHFRTLEALFPDRIDCGIGRASGGDAYSRSLLATNPAGLSGQGEDDFVTQVDALDRFLHDECKRAIAMPSVRRAPPIWLLSSGGHPKSGALAAEKGLGLALALFVNPHADPRAAAEYRRHFQPSEEFSEPRVILAVNCVCSQDPEKLRSMQKLSDFFRLMRDSNNYPRFLPDPARLKDCEFDTRQTEYLESIANREVSGTPDEVKRQIALRLEQYGADEMMLSIFSFALDDKIETMDALASGCGLAGSGR